MLGVHWIADAVGCRVDRLTVSSVREALIELPERLELTRIGDPQVFEHDEVGGAATSIAGIVLIAESHVSIHCFPRDATVHIDIFSCKAMNLDTARNYVENHFAPRAVEENILDRGRESEGPRAAHVRRAR